MKEEYIPKKKRKKNPISNYLPYLFLIIFILIIGCSKKENKVMKSVENEKIIPKKILYVGSYNSGNFWSDGITAGIKESLKKRKGIELKIFRMDSKKYSDEKSKRNAGLKAKQIIETWKPDLVITSDDNAAKYLIAPYYINSDLPFVFCGINWDASIYGLPCKNVTGMIEISLVQEFLKNIRPIARGDKIGYIAPNTTSAKQVLKQNQKIVKINSENVKFVKNFSQWKEAYKHLQKNADILLMANWRGINDWNETEARKFILENTKIPSGSFYKDLAKYTLACFSNDPKEQGEWAGKTALEILNGKKPDQIKTVTNKKAEIFLNMTLAKKMNILFPINLVEIATLVK